MFDRIKYHKVPMENKLNRIVYKNWQIIKKLSAINVKPQPNELAAIKFFVNSALVICPN